MQKSKVHSARGELSYSCVVVSLVMADAPPVAFLLCLQPQLIATEQFNSKNTAG